MKRRTRMYEPWGYRDENDYISKKTIVDNELAESKKNDEKEFKDIDELKNAKFDEAKYDSDSKKIVFTANGNKVAEIDAIDFVKDGMIESVELDGTTLRIIFNTESGKEEIDIDLKELFNKDLYYTKDEVDGFLNEKANVSDLDDYAKIADVDAKLETKADKADIPSLDGYATEAWVESKNYLTEHQDVSYLATKAEVDASVSALKAFDEAISGAVDNVSAEVENEAQRALSAETGLQDAINLKANSADVDAALALKADKSEIPTDFYTKGEVDGKDDALQAGIDANVTAIATEETARIAADEAQDAIIATKADASAVTESIEAEKERAISAETDLQAAIDLKADKETTYTKEDVDELLATKDAEIDEIQAAYDRLNDMVLDLYYATTYSIPADSTLDTMLKSKSGEAKLTEDITTGTITAGITAKNIVKLNLGGKTVTFTGSSTSSPAMMFRNKQQVNIGGSGTIDAGGRVAVETDGADCVVTLSGTMFGRPTYTTDRSGGELIYCYLGTINITDGIFKNNGEDKKFLLNCYDANYKAGTAKIVVTGGKFYDFNPADNSAEGEHTNFVAEGYHVEISQDGDSTVYTVKKDA